MPLWLLPAWRKHGSGPWGGESFDPGSWPKDICWSVVRVVRGGRVYMHHMIKLLRTLHKREHMNLSFSFFADLRWWAEFSEIFNGEVDIIDVSTRRTRK